MTITKSQIGTLQFIAGIVLMLSSHSGIAAKSIKTQKVAQKQAKEVLGIEFKSSTVQAAVKMPNIHHAIYKTVRKSVPKKFSNKSHKIFEVVIQEAAKYNFDPVFVMAVIQTESSFNPLAIGPVGEIGMMQIRPSTGAWIAEKFKIENYKGEKSLKDPVMNIKIGVAYLSVLRKSFKGFGQKYVSAYNMGAKKVRQLSSEDIVPKEYHSRIVKNYSGIYQRLVASASVHTRSMTTEMP